MTNNFKLLKVCKMNSLEIYKSPVMEKLETSNLDSKVNLIQSVPLGTLHQELVTSLPHNQVTLTTLFTSSYRGAIIKFGQ